MQADELKHEGSALAEEVDSESPVALLLAELHALERALTTWDLAGIANHEAGARAALERTVRAGAAKPEYLRALMTVTGRCRRLSENGTSIAASVTRLGALTYSAPRADKSQEGQQASETDGHGGSSTDGIT